MNFNIDAGYYIKLIRQITKEPIIDFEKVKQDQLVEMSTFDIFLYNTKKLLFVILENYQVNKRDE